MEDQIKGSYTLAVLELVERSMGDIKKYPHHATRIISFLIRRLNELTEEFKEVL